MSTRKLLICLMSVMLLAACGSTAEENGAGGEQEELERITFMLGTRPSMAAAPWYLGIENGIFEDAGIDLVLEAAESPSVGMAAVLDGQAEFGSVDFTTLALAKTDEPDTDMRILSITYARPPYAIYSLGSGAAIDDPEELSGRTVHGPTGSSMLKILQVWLDELGIEDVTFKEIDTAAREPLLLAGKLDAIVGFSTSIPGLEQAAEKQGDELVVLEPAEHGLETYYASGIAATTEFIEANEDLTRRFLEAHVEAFEYAFENPQEAAEVLNKNFPELEVDLTVAGMPILEELMTDAGRVEENGVIEPDKVEATIDYADEVLGIDVSPEDLYLTDYLGSD